ncbi:MAG: hypothetical protein AAGU11_15070, partial [Syntrophobacteraceae bacterium]
RHRNSLYSRRTGTRQELTGRDRAETGTIKLVARLYCFSAHAMRVKSLPVDNFADTTLTVP